MTRSALISGAGIAGPVLAHHLHEHGWEVTVVERSGAVRAGGYPIDVRGCALDVLEALGVLEEVRAAHVHTRRLTFLDRAGRRITSIRPEALTGGLRGRDLEVPRGTLMQVLYERTRNSACYRFGESAESVEQDPGGVDVRFRSGAQQRFDLVFGADGLHSGVRALAFGPERRYERYLDQCFAGFTLDDRLGLRHEGVVWNEPGRFATAYAVGDSGPVYGFLSLHRTQRPDMADPDAVHRLLTEAFAGDGWEVPALLTAARTADDLFFDVVSQIRMPTWSTGRVALVGDAAHAPSFLSGQGTSLALVGAHVLAGELARQREHRAAFAGYEQRLREHVRRNQDIAGGGGSTLMPSTRAKLLLRNGMLRALPLLTRAGITRLGGRAQQRAINGFELPAHPARR